MLTPEIQLVIAAVAGMLGAAYQFSFQKPAGFNVAQRLLSFLVGTTLTGLLAALFIIRWNWDFIVISILSLLLGTGAEKFVRLAMESQNSAKTPQEFIGKWKRAQRAFNEEPPDDAPDTTTQQPEKQPEP